MIVPLLLGLALVGSAWVAQREARSLAPILDRGQSETYLRALRDTARPPMRPTAAQLSMLLDRYRADGLRYLAVLDARRGVIAEAGDSVFAQGAYPGPHELERGNGRVRVLTPPPPPPPPPMRQIPNATADWPPAPPPGAFSPGAFPPGAFPPESGPGANRQLPPLDNTVVLEFVPLPADGLLARAKTSAVGSVAAALLLTLAAGLLWRQQSRAQAEEAQWEQRRHLARLGEMSAVLAHEIRNPLAAAKGHAQLLAERIDASDPARPQVDQVVAHVERLETLTRSLLDFARSDEVQRESVSPAELMRDVVISMEPQRLSLDVDSAPDAWPLDPVRIRQVFVNILQNALQSSPPDSGVDVRIWQDNESLAIRIRDRGPGVAEGEEEKIFEPFHTKRVRGTGLGLAVARRIVEAHGGSLVFERPTDGGAQFVIRVPRE